MGYRLHLPQILEYKEDGTWMLVVLYRDEKRRSICG